jgi:hypothetical protein
MVLKCRSNCTTIPVPISASVSSWSRFRPRSVAQYRRKPTEYIISSTSRRSQGPAPLKNHSFQMDEVQGLGPWRGAGQSPAARRKSIIPGSACPGHRPVSEWPGAGSKDFQIGTPMTRLKRSMSRCPVDRLARSRHATRRRRRSPVPQQLRRFQPRTGPWPGFRRVPR